MRKGFTLIEMLVVVAILGLLATVLLVTINPVTQLQKSNDARRKADLESVTRALELYNQDNGKYPAALPAWGGTWSPYMATLPKDPAAAYHYVYYSPAPNQSYYIYAHLERGNKDPQVCNSGALCSSAPVGTTCGAVCNYGVASSDKTP